MADGAAGSSLAPLARKLGVKSGFRIRLVDAPAHHFALLGPVPEGVREIADKGVKRHLMLISASHRPDFPFGADPPRSTKSQFSRWFWTRRGGSARGGKAGRCDAEINMQQHAYKELSNPKTRFGSRDWTLFRPFDLAEAGGMPSHWQRILMFPEGPRYERPSVAMA